MNKVKLAAAAAVTPNGTKHFRSFAHLILEIMVCRSGLNEQDLINNILAASVITDRSPHEVARICKRAAMKREPFPWEAK